MDPNVEADDFLNDLDSDSQYEYVTTLGKGAYGRVDATRHRVTGKMYAKKTMEFLDLAESGIPSNAIREVSLLKELDHPNIIKIEDIIYSRPKLHLIMEYMDSDLKKYMEEHHPLPPARIQEIMKNIIEGVKEMHWSRAIHRDIKPENIFINSDGDLKIGDFGISRTFGVSSKPLSKDVVTIFYRAPEIALGIKEYSIPIDIWSWGCIFAELYLGKPLFYVDNELDLINQIFKAVGTPSEVTWPGVEEKLNMVMPKYPTKDITIEGMDDTGHDLLNKMLTLNPVDRIWAKEALKHPYFTKSFED